jgi:hypothetical protein
MTIESEDDDFNWKVGETIKLFKTFSFSRIEGPKKGGGFGELFPVYEPKNDIIMMAKKANVNEIIATSMIRKEAKILLMLPPHANVLESFVVQKINGTCHIFT